MDINLRRRLEVGAATIAALGLITIAAAGTEVSPAAVEATNSGDWCSWLSNKPGVIYKNKENPYLQEIQLEGRFQYQAGYVEGSDTAGRDFDETYDEYRRVRLGLKAKFLQYFGVKYQVNLVDDGRPFGRDLDWGYDSIDEAYLSFDLGKALGGSGFDELSLIYGRQKFLFGTEAHTSSTKLLTIERTALANKVYGSARPTGLTLQGAKGPLSFAASVYSSTTDGADNLEFNGWQDSFSVLLNLGYQVNEQLLLRGDFTHNQSEGGNREDTVTGYEWALGLGAEYDAGPWGLNADFIYGDNGDALLANGATRSGDFYGLQMTPWVWLVEDKLQLVGQYQYQGSEGANGVRVNSRYGRADGITGINSGRGDSHHSVYSGLNYYLCGHSAKIQAGIEYQTMDTPAGDFHTLTYLMGFRTYF